MPELELTVASGEELAVRRFEAQEGVSDFFKVDVYAMSQDPNVDLEAMIGKPTSFKAASGYAHVALDGIRTWSGICSFAELVKGNRPSNGKESDLNEYRVQLVPDLWLLRHRRNHRIFQHLSVPDIVDEILKDWGQQGTWEAERGDYPKLEYRVQYGESDYDFISRLLEEAGISFTFPDHVGGSRLTFGDHLHQNQPRAAPPLTFTDNPNEVAQKEYVSNLRLSREVRPGAFVLRDHDFRSPAFELFGEASPRPPEDNLEQYRYQPGGTLIEGGQGGPTPVADDKSVARHDQPFGHAKAERSLEAARTGRSTVTFDTNAVDLWPGMVTEIDGHPHGDLSQPILVTRFVIRGNAEGEEWSMRGVAVFADVPFRTPIHTPKPNIHGVQCAVVVGPPGEEIYPDEFGRVRVQFPWDREGKSDDDSSVWMRVSQGWAGTGFGMIQIPRIGQEVLVGFLEGDPDQPIVVGRVYNGVEQVPYPLPANKTVSGWKTNSSPGGGGYNEIKLEDKAGKELFYVQAQKNYDELIKNDETERTLGHHRKTVVKNQDLVVKQNKRELVEANDSRHVKADAMDKVDGTMSLTVGADAHAKIGNLHAVEAGEEIHLKAGSKVVLEAGSRLTIKGPGGFIDIHAGGIDIVGTIVNINSGGSAGSGAGAAPTEPSDPQEAEPVDHS